MDDVTHRDDNTRPATALDWLLFIVVVPIFLLFLFVVVLPALT